MPNNSNAQRLLRGRMGMKKRGKNPLEDRIIAQAAIDTISFIEDEAQAAHNANGLTLKHPDQMSISELALDNTLFASRNINLFLRKVYVAQQESDEIDLKRDRLAVEASNATMRTLARVHEAYLRGQNTDRLGQILEEIKRLESDKS